ncbi:hypothetical protein KTU01_31620 [Kocuria turfanensis]|uniref:Uncharacterized protein n=1 Tax=Kocuria turfanensis TaxID=388357 RepID=A0A512IH44_9MICC|nr:hypothetical protein KTU01_31620 [Kocuria turfanensis]
MMATGPMMTGGQNISMCLLPSHLSCGRYDVEEGIDTSFMPSWCRADPTDTLVLRRTTHGAVLTVEKTIGGAYVARLVTAGVTR